MKEKIDSIIAKVDKVQQKPLTKLLEQLKKEIMEGVECLYTKQ